MQGAGGDSGRGEKDDYGRRRRGARQVKQRTPLLRQQAGHLRGAILSSDGNAFTSVPRPYRLARRPGHDQSQFVHTGMRASPATKGRSCTKALDSCHRSYKWGPFCTARAMVSRLLDGLPARRPGVARNQEAFNNVQSLPKYGVFCGDCRRAYVVCRCNPTQLCGASRCFQQHGWVDDAR